MNERISHILKSPWTTHLGVGALAAGAGVGIGYLLWGRDQFEIVVPAEETPEELDGATFFDTEGIAEAQRVIDAEEYDTTVISEPIMVPETDAEVTDNSVIVRGSSPGDLVEVNVFETQDPDWDWDKEIAGRDDEKPYIIHFDEFYQNSTGFTQQTLSYYKGDDIMCDEEDVPVFDYMRQTGPLLFGHGSGDPSTVLVRNTPNKVEYEIQLNEGRFEVLVLGLDYQDSKENQDLKHSKERRFRATD